MTQATRQRRDAETTAQGQPPTTQAKIALPVIWHRRRTCQKKTQQIMEKQTPQNPNNKAWTFESNAAPYTYMVGIKYNHAADEGLPATQDRPEGHRISYGGNDTNRQTDQERNTPTRETEGVATAPREDQAHMGDRLTSTRKRQLPTAQRHHREWPPLAPLPGTRERR